MKKKEFKRELNKAKSRLIQTECELVDVKCELQQLRENHWHLSGRLLEVLEKYRNLYNHRLHQEQLMKQCLESDVEVH